MLKKEGCVMGAYFTHLSFNDRLLIDRLIRDNYKVSEIAKIIGKHESTVYKELKRSTYIHTNSDLTTEIRYNPDGAEKRYRNNLKKKGPGLKIEEDYALADFIEDEILTNKSSPWVALQKARERKRDFLVEIKSVNTIYSYIKKGDIFYSLTMPDTPYRRKGKRGKVIRQVRRVAAGTSIEKRPENVLDREMFGHCELDTVKGQNTNKKSILVLTERKTRFEIMEVLNRTTVEEVRKAINRVKKRYGKECSKIFKTITVDNGPEFADPKVLSIQKGKHIETVFYCHPYPSWERGSNENQNKLVRRHLPKSSDFDKVLNRNVIKDIEAWINNYPRQMFDGKASRELFDKEISKLIS